MGLYGRQAAVKSVARTPYGIVWVHYITAQVHLLVIDFSEKAQLIMSSGNS